VLAQAEWYDESIVDGLMLDTEGELVCGTACNVFLVRSGLLVTPDLRFCGVLGVMRAEVLRLAKELDIAVSEEPLWPHDAEAASEVFITSSVRGVRSVTELGALRWNDSPARRPTATGAGFLMRRLVQILVLLLSWVWQRGGARLVEQQLVAHRSPGCSRRRHSKCRAAPVREACALPCMHAGSWTSRRSGSSGRVSRAVTAR
jgi:4-amino-4-deoxychorismate lyase